MDYLCDRIRNRRPLNYCEHDFPLTINYVMSHRVTHSKLVACILC